MLKSSERWRWRRRSADTAAFTARWKVRGGVDQEFREQRERQRLLRVGLWMSEKELVQWTSSSLGIFFSTLCSPFSLSVSAWDPGVQNRPQEHSTAGATWRHHPPESCWWLVLSFHSACTPGQQVQLHQRLPLFTHLATPQNCIITLTIRGFL